MSNKTIVLKFICPKCGTPARAEVKKQLYKFLIYVCPKCDSNVVYYDKKIDVLSDKFVEVMTKKTNLQFSGRAIFPKKPKIQPRKTNGKQITEDTIVDLKILLNTVDDFDSLLSQL